MENSDGIGSKSSNEILSELFGAFNVEPPNVMEKPKSSSSEADDSERSKKSKKSKRKKSKKKHKSKKRKRKHSNTESERESDSSINNLKKKKKKKKEKKSKKSGRVSSPTNVNYELPVNQVPMALDIILDGTVGIKGEDGVINKIPDVNDVEKDSKESKNVVNGALTDSVACENKDVKNVGDEKTEDKPVNPSKVPVVFDVEPVEKSEKLKKGKIQIRNLKFSSVYHETIKAVEEKQKKKQERKAEIEEGELSDSSESDEQLTCDVSGDGLETKRKNDDIERRYSSHSKTCPDREELRIHVKKKSKSRHRSTTRSRSRSASHSRSRSRHRSRSRYYSHNRISHKRARSRSRDYYPYHHSDNHRKRSRISPSSTKQSHLSSSRDRHRSRSRSRRSRERREKNESSHKTESRERPKTTSKERADSVEKIDKEKLLAIARKNALKLIDAGVVPGGDKLTTLKAGGKTVNELTEYCKKLSKKEALEKDVSDIESESSDEGEKPFHHPFQVRDRPNSIIMNIKNSIPLPVKSLQEKTAEQSKQLRLQFPVSSGSSHRRTENEWVPVIPKKEESSEKQVAISQSTMPPTMPFVAPLPVEPSTQMRVPERYPMLPMTEFSAVPPPQPFNRPIFPVIQPNPPQVPRLDISSIVSKRLEAMRKLQENPNDVQALNEMYNAQQEMQFWAESKQEPGAFTGTTGVKILSASELSSGAHAWAKRNQLAAATPVKGGMGMTLLQKMGWQPGEGLGKNKEGTLEPLRLEVKMDKKGLVASDESQRGKKGGMIQGGLAPPTVKTLDGKHPVSLLNEYCSRRRFEAPCFELCFECGPDHKKNFLFKVKVNGVEYTPTIASPNKKMAKAEAAAICLKSLGVISNTS